MQMCGKISEIAENKSNTEEDIISIMITVPDRSHYIRLAMQLTVCVSGNARSEKKRSAG